MSNIGTKFILADRFTFDPNNNSLVDNESDTDLVRLGSNESRILLLLCERPNEVITRHELHEFVWRDQGFEVDDSSLTQAISTLRKMLKDSTKSPLFVKTVPKRGYQLICSVKATTVLASSKEVTSFSIEENPMSEPDVSASAIEESKQVPDANENKVSALSVEPNGKLTTPSTLMPKLLLLLAMALPLMVVLFTTPSESKFRELAVYQDVPVITPFNHPDLSQWLPSLELCVNSYLNQHKDELTPIKVIATGGQNEQVILNYIHTVEQSSNNKTVRIVWKNPDINKVCL
ncbi:transcriptional regulator [Vibrio sp. YMD68]|uniref:winged helix-turn-helix domain-containing protein n=1 Tax=Vibrio sp. YMD68 TaxID=3042300 RepID=UPI00249C7876|nr:transcriptional regulator [Vibrio sp. YMD68]WGW01133.1 transcriptional regulator [Vibrio sp. YMD68]